MVRHLTTHNSAEAAVNSHCIKVESILKNRCGGETTEPRFKRTLGRCRGWLEQARGRTQSGDHRQAVKELHHARYVQRPDWVIKEWITARLGIHSCKNEYDRRVVHTRGRADGAG